MSGGSSSAGVVTNNGVMETDGAKVVSVVTPVTAQKSEPPVITSGGQQQFSVKSEPLQFSVKSEPVVSVANTTAPTLLSWPAGQYQPTFQLQVSRASEQHQRPYHFSL